MGFAGKLVRSCYLHFQNWPLTQNTITTLLVPGFLEYNFWIIRKSGQSLLGKLLMKDDEKPAPNDGQELDNPLPVV